MNFSETLPVVSAENPAEKSPEKKLWQKPDVQEFTIGVITAHGCHCAVGDSTCSS